MREIEGIDKALEMLKPHWPEINAVFERENRKFLALRNADTQILGRVLRVHLIVEHYMDLWLTDHLQTSNLSDARLNFFQKAQILPTRSAVSILKPGIFELNSLRNKFAHRLDYLIGWGDVAKISELVRLSRPDTSFEYPIETVEEFCAMAAAFLSVWPEHLRKPFIEAFSHVHEVERSPEE